VFGLAYLLTAASVMLTAISGITAFAVWFFNPHG
jgi:hypothetical protein